MEPRWKYDRPLQYKFVGGTPDFDIWYLSTRNRGPNVYIALVNGHSADEWASYPFIEGVLVGYGQADENDASTLDLKHLVVQKHEEVETYLKLFAPWIVEESHAQT